VVVWAIEAARFRPRCSDQAIVSGGVIVSTWCAP
jgi:hypothetical protein